MSETKHNISTELLGISALNSFAAHNSPSRSTMMTSHFGQRLVIEDGDEQIIQSGISYRLSKHNFSIKMPENGRIIKVIDRYKRSISSNDIKFNPETIIIYEIDDTKEIDCFSVPYHASYHYVFGFRYKFNEENMMLLRPGNYITKGTIFADSYAASENGGYKFGINLNTAYMSVPAIALDGIVVCEDVLPRLAFRLYETRIVEFGSNSFPLNLYGDTTTGEYKPFKEIGEELDNSGLLMVIRQMNEEMAPVDTSIYDTMETDFTFDKCTYARQGVGKIVDIKVVGNSIGAKKCPPQVTDLVKKYEQAYMDFHRELLSAEEVIRREKQKKFDGVGYQLTPRFHNLLVSSLAITNRMSKNTPHVLNLLHKKEPVDEYRIEFTIEYVIVPTIGFKLTDLSGGDQKVILH